MPNILKITEEANVRAAETETTADAELKRQRNAPIHEIRELVAKEVKGEAVGMIRSAIASVNNGQYLGMKYLFEIVGIYPPVPGDDSPREESLAAILLRQLGLPGISLAQDAVTKDSPRGSDRDEGHTVE